MRMAFYPQDLSTTRCHRNFLLLFRLASECSLLTFLKRDKIKKKKEEIRKSKFSERKKNKTILLPNAMHQDQRNLITP
jgi:hypothetical protein